MNTCNVCEVSIEQGNEVTTDGKPMHEVCHRLLNDLSVPCKVCGLSIGGRNGLVKHVDGVGLCKFHVVCYQCVECGAFTNISLLDAKDRCLPFCEKCKKCFNCKNINYVKCEVTVKDDHPDRRFIILCGVCMGVESEEFNIFDDINEGEDNFF